MLQWIRGRRHIEFTELLSDLLEDGVLNNRDVGLASGNLETTLLMVETELNESDMERSRNSPGDPTTL